MEPIRLRGARQNNLKGVDLDVEPGELLVVTGPSGAGKSSLAIDTLYAEGQRRYVESFSPYARQFLDRAPRPRVDELRAAPPAIAVDRTAPARSGRSTVATRTEVAEAVKLLFARASEVTCESCGRPVRRERPEAVAAELRAAHTGARGLVWFPQPTPEGAEGLLAARDALLPAGFGRVVGAEGAVSLDEVRPSDLPRLLRDGALRVVVDRLGLEDERRLGEALATAMDRGGRAGVDVEGVTVRVASRALRCEACGLEARDPSPSLFSYNSPLGACPECSGFGRVIELDFDKVVENPSLTIDKGALKPFRGPKRRWERAELRKFCARKGIPTSVPWSELSGDQKCGILEGGGRGDPWWGVRAWFGWIEERSYKMHYRILLARYRTYVPCPSCGGRRFAPAALRYGIGGLAIADLYAMPVAETLERLGAMGLEADPAAAVLLREITGRLTFLVDVGLGYLTLDRMTRTLSGGEAQRVGLAHALGASLAGTLFVVDEPTVGLHPADAPGLVRAVRRLASQGNPTVVVDNHPAFVAEADRVADLGPGAGEAGGEIVYHGPVAGLAGARSPTARLLAPSRPLRRRTRRRPTGWLEVRGAAAHNLRDVDVRIPLGVVTAVTGPSGSGKSSLVDVVLARALARALGEAGEAPGRHRELRGASAISELVVMDQSPLGRTSRGNPATYVKAWDVLRGRLAATPAAAEAGLSASAFSFNVRGGRCDSCDGEGAETVEMQFLPDVRLVCDECGGTRFKPEVLAVSLGGLTVADLLETTVDDVLARFAGDRQLCRRLAPIAAVGLGYLRLGQSLATLSGGEAQRLKLARALGAVKPGAFLVLDEPTVGLHPSDVDRLVAALDGLVDAKRCSVLVVEHEMSVAARADWVVDLGPGAGEAGGTIVAEGTPEAVAASASATAPFLAAALDGLAEVPASAVAEPRAPYRAGAEAVRVRGAREHNLVDLDVDVPRGGLTVVTGPSGSGKTTLAFDVVHAEGQRRYIESLSTFVRQHLKQLPRPEVDRVDGVAPSVALEPRPARAGGSTVSTLTEVGHFLRLLYAKVGTQHCPACALPVEARTRGQIQAEARRIAGQGRASLLARVVQNRKGTHRDVVVRAATSGVARVRVDGVFHPTDPPPALARYREHDVDLEVAVLEPGAEVDAAVDEALRLGKGTVRILDAAGAEHLLSGSRSCPGCGRGFEEIDPTMLSFHTKRGMCPACEGRGAVPALDEEAALVPGLPLGEGGLGLLGIKEAKATVRRRLGRAGVPLDKPFEALTKTQRAALMEGKGPWAGLLWMTLSLAGEGLAEARDMLRDVSCPACGGSRLAEGPRHVALLDEDGSGLTLPTLTALPVASARRWLDELSLPPRARAVGDPLRAEAARRLAFLEETGVGYLTLDRAAETLSGGETQRVRLAAQLGAGLTGVSYVLDEPTIGLHPRDTDRLLGTLRRLADGGCTVLVVEHDESTIRAADHVIDMGPGGGSRGGRIVSQGPPAAILADPASPTGRALTAARGEVRPRRPLDGAPLLGLRGAAGHNLKAIDVTIPLGRLTVVSGVSGSGKSTLVRETLYRGVRRALGLIAARPAPFEALEGTSPLRRALEVDQSPIGRTPRSVPATYIGIWNDIRQILARTPEARARGFEASRFSFNTPGGRCEACAGQGSTRVEMSFLPDVEARCEACGGSRFDEATREVTYRGLSVDRILAASVEEALATFEAFPRVRRALELLDALGLGYLALGQPSSTLSGGEAQRIKLAAELHGRARGGTLYVLDEPTTGLHLADVARLVAVLSRLVDRGDTVVVIEHHPDVILAADHVLDLGPEGGDEGGRLVAAGTPDEVMAVPGSHTGAALREALARLPSGVR